MRAVFPEAGGMTHTWDAVIIGAGTAGLSAAQMLGRSRRRTLVVDAGQPRNRFAAHMHGVLGHDGKEPTALLESGRAEAERYGVEFANGTVTALSDDGDSLRVEREDGTVAMARTVVIASGVRDELPPVPGLAENWGRAVLHCPYCHGWEVAGQRLGVLATSPMSTHQAQLVRQLSDDVTLFSAAAEPLDEEARVDLAARSIRVVASAVSMVDGRGDALLVTTADGEEHAFDAIFTGGSPVFDLGFADALALARSEQPGAPLTVDALGATSHPRVFAAGNVTAAFANVPVSMGEGAMAGAAANAALVAEDIELAVAARTAERNAGWEERYAERERHWSGGVNPAIAAIAAIVSELPPGTALDVGSGEGGDVVWLAENGWTATGVDVSPTAVERARNLAQERGVDVVFRLGDGAASVPGRFDLVLSSFLHSWEDDFPRIRMLRDAAERVTPGGRLLVVSHAAPPPWAHEMAEHAPLLRGPEKELALLALDPSEWTTEIAELRRRPVTGPEGEPAHLDDGVLLLRRRA